MVVYAEENRAVNRTTLGSLMGRHCRGSQEETVGALLHTGWGINTAAHPNLTTGASAGGGVMFPEASTGDGGGRPPKRPGRRSLQNDQNTRNRYYLKRSF